MGTMLMLTTWGPPLNVTESVALASPATAYSQITIPLLPGATALGVLGEKMQFAGPGLARCRRLGRSGEGRSRIGHVTTIGASTRGVRTEGAFASGRVESNGC